MPGGGDWNKPTLSSAYTNFMTELTDRDEDCALMFDGTAPTNTPTDAIRFNKTAQKFQKWDGAAWVDAVSKYLIDVDTVDGKHNTDFVDSSHAGAGGAAHAAATISVAGFLAAADKTIIDGLGTISTINSPVPVANGGTGGTTAATARTNLGLGTSATKNTGVSNGDVPLMDATGYPAASGAQITSISSAPGLGNSVVENVAAGGSGDLLRNDGSGASLTSLPSQGFKTVQRFTASGTWTKPAGLVRVRVMTWGGGGGGGGSGGSNGGGGAGGGAYAESVIEAASLGATETTTIGAKGTGGAASTNGTDGGITDFGASPLVRAQNGNAGGGASGGPGSFGIAGDAVTSIGDFKWDGEHGSVGHITSDLSAPGGSTYNFAGPGAKTGGPDATFPGCGGGGAEPGSIVGGDGKEGLIIVEEYF